MSAKGLLKLCFPFVYPASFQVLHPAADQKDGPVRPEGGGKTDGTDRRLLCEMRLDNIPVIAMPTDVRGGSPPSKSLFRTEEEAGRLQEP